MSGGDGRGPGNSGPGHNGGKSSGNTKGTAGKGDHSSGGGTHPDRGPGWGTTHTPDGDIHNYNPGVFGGGGNKPGGIGGNSGNHSGGTRHGKPSGMAVAFGVPAVLGPSAGDFGFALSAEAVSAAMTEAFGLLKGPFKFGLWGVALYGILPGEMAKDDPKMMSKIVTSLPADTVTGTPASALPLQQATVGVKQRVVDVVKDQRQHIAVVAGLPMSVPVVDAKPTKRPGVFSASVPGLPDLQVSVTRGVPVAKTRPKGVTPEKGVSRPAGFTAGGSSHDAVIRFPKESGQKPVYVSVTDVLTSGQVKQRQEEENRRQREWDAMHPVEVAGREYEKAKTALDAENRNISARQAELGRLKNTPEGLTLRDAKAHPLISKERKFVRVIGYSGGGATFDVEAIIDNQEKPGQLIKFGGTGYVTNILQFGKVTAPTEDGEKVGNAIRTELIAAYNKLRQRLIARQAGINNAQLALNAALESRRQKEKKKKNAENKLNDEKNKPRKGTKDYGHDYHPVPKTEDIKGLGELKRGDPQTPKQGGGGKRARWYGDKKRKIYEWDSRHGELEGYRASDGEHLGAFDPKTGKQVKGPDPKRNIKKYL